MARLEQSARPIKNFNALELMFCKSFIYLLFFSGFFGKFPIRRSFHINIFISGLGVNQVFKIGVYILCIMSGSLLQEIRLIRHCLVGAPRRVGSNDYES